MDKENLLEKARRDYPVGTKYYAAHLSGEDHTICTVGNPDDFRISHSGDILESNGNKEKNDHVFNECVYESRGKRWAKIKSKPKDWKDSIAVGDKVVVLSANSTGHGNLCNNIKFYKERIGKVCKVSEVGGISLDDPAQRWIRLDSCSNAIGSAQVRAATKDDSKEWWKTIKEGDIIACTEKEGRGGAGFKANEVFRVREIRANGDYSVIMKVKENNVKPNGVYRDEIRPATTKEIAAYEANLKGVKPSSPPIDTNGLSNEERLAEAIKRYPIGTIINDPGPNRIKRAKIVHTPKLMGSGEIGGGSGYIYHKGVWAEIVELPKTEDSLLSEARAKYPVGTKYRCLHGCGEGEVFDETSFSIDSPSCIRTNNETRCCYNGDKWAEIIPKSGLTINDLVKGEIYYHHCNNFKYIIKFTKLYGKQINGNGFISLHNNSFDSGFYANTAVKELRIATNDEKKWLNACIDKGRFVSMEETLEEGLKIEALAKGQVYRFELSDNRLAAIAKWGYFTLDINTQCVHTEWTDKSMTNSTYHHNIKLATDEEIQWMEACKNAGYYMDKESALKKKTMKYKLGPIRFKEGSKKGHIPDSWTSAAIPTSKIIHGSAGLHEEYTAEIVDYHNEYYIVKYLDRDDNYTQLGFLEDALEPVGINDDVKVGDYAIMTNAGGYSYDPKNNGCLAKVTEVGSRVQVDAGTVPTISGKVINPKTDNKSYHTFSDIPLKSGDRDQIWRKATQAEIDVVMPKPLKEAIDMYPIGSYIVWDKKVYSSNIGDIEKVTDKGATNGCIKIEKYGSFSIDRIEDGEASWFATLEEARKYSSKILNKPSSEFKVDDWVTQEGWNGQAFRIKRVTEDKYILDCEQGDGIGSYPKICKFRLATTVERNRAKDVKQDAGSIGPDILTKGEVYRFEYYDGGIYINRMNTHDEIGNYITVKSKNYSNIGGGRYLKQDVKVTRATPHEIAWLEACEKVGKFVPSNEVLHVKTNKSAEPDFSLKDEPVITKGIDLIN